MGDDFKLVNSVGVVFDGTITDPGATEGDVLTVQSDGSIAAAAGGGSGTVTSVSSADTSIVVTSATTTPSLQLASLSTIAANEGGTVPVANGGTGQTTAQAGYAALGVAGTVTVASNAGTCAVANRVNTFTNSSAATMAITIATAGATDGQTMIVRVYDFSAAAETIGWTNTENSTVTAPTTSNGSTTLPLTVGFQFNGATSKWRCVATA